MRRLQRGMRRLGGWPFWLGFWTALLFGNVRRQHLRDAEQRGRQAFATMQDPLYDLGGERP
jgi:hypothetical protein